MSASASLLLLLPPPPPVPRAILGKSPSRTNRTDHKRERGSKTKVWKPHKRIRNERKIPLTYLLLSKTPSVFCLTLHALFWRWGNGKVVKKEHISGYYSTAERDCLAPDAAKREKLYYYLSTFAFCNKNKIRPDSHTSPKEKEKSKVRKAAQSPGRKIMSQGCPPSAPSSHLKGADMKEPSSLPPKCMASKRRRMDNQFFLLHTRIGRESPVSCAWPYSHRDQSPAHRRNSGYRFASSA